MTSSSTTYQHLPFEPGWCHFFQNSGDPADPQTMTPPHLLPLRQGQIPSHWARLLFSTLLHSDSKSKACHRGKGSCLPP